MSIHCPVFNLLFRESGMSLVQGQLTDCIELIRERNRAVSLHMSVELLDHRISSCMSKVRQSLAIEEQKLSDAESNRNIPTSELKKWEQAVLAASQQVDRLETPTKTDTTPPRKPLGNIANTPERNSGKSSVRQIPGYKAFVNVEDNTEHADLDNSELLQLHSRIIEQQDSHLDGLSETIARQKQMGQLISNELDMHVDLLDETEQVVDSTHARLNTAATRLGRVMEDHASNSQGIDFVGFQN
ncbi:hypothetical protein O5D80_007978 [Batrachochytrium dendrobatidis]|nr:hypothetical protein O5D80_007978 [Batrachochytrium dendrobatidis]